MKQMGRDGYLLGVSWPKRYGGQERSAVEQFLFADEVQATGFPLPFLTLNTVGPTLREYGTEEQSAQYFCPRILAGEVFFAIGYSEPGAGTDLASLHDPGSARRRRVGDPRPEDVDQPGRLCRLHLARRAHRPRQAQARGPLDLPRAHRLRGLLAAGGEHGRRRLDERHVLRRRTRARGEPDRRREQRLAPDHGPAQPRAHLADDGRAAAAQPARGGTDWARRDRRRRRAADRQELGAAQPGSRPRQGRGACA